MLSFRENIDFVNLPDLWMVFFITQVDVPLILHVGAVRCWLGGKWQSSRLNTTAEGWHIASKSNDDGGNANLKFSCR